MIQHENKRYQMLTRLLMILVVGVIAYASVSIVVAKKSPLFKRGDCIVDKRVETWEPVTIFKIKQIGKTHYLYTYEVAEPMMIVNVATFADVTATFEDMDSVYEKIECPIELQ